MKQGYLIALNCLLIIICSSFKSFSQRVTFSDMKYVLYHDLADNEDYLIKKGFTYSGITDYEDGTSRFDYSKNSKYSKEYVSISKVTYKHLSYQSSFYTVSQNDYILFKTQIKQLGFLLKKAERYEQSTVFDFQKVIWK